MLDSIAVNTACDQSAASRAALATCAEIVRRKLPNFFRPYLNPYVAQTCYCLDRAVQAAWPFADSPYQTFLANGFEEALSGAIKLARCDRSALKLSTTGLVVDEANRLEHFAFTNLADGRRLEFVPGLDFVADVESLLDRLDDPDGRIGFIVVSAATVQADEHLSHRLAALATEEPRPLLIVCVDREQLFLNDPGVGDAWRAVTPDVVVFDESFVDFGVPFGAFSATANLYGRWNGRGMSTFHSTTYQPNTTSTLHFMRCLEQARPAFVERHADELARLDDDLAFRHEQFRRLYNPSLAKLIATVGLEQRSMRAVGHYIETSDSKLFDAVAGVACSVRGHNPEEFETELERGEALPDVRREVARRMESLTGLAHLAPAVSGASAVEQALKLALAAQSPRDHVLALSGGFGGKTLFALTGTAKPALKAGLHPLYPHVTYVDPFAVDAVPQIEAHCERLPIGVLQAELVQGVGGVRALPSSVVECLARMRDRHRALLLIDEVQTGVYRTGPFVRSHELGIRPDVLTIGKGTSDMMFPFALTAYSDVVLRRLDARGCTLPQVLETRFGYELGYRTVLNMLRRAESEGLEHRVREAGERLATLLTDELKHCRVVREVRCFGLLVGIELNITGIWRRFRQVLPRLYLLALMNHRPFPVVAGFCQYEPHVLKLTPPLSITDDEIRRLAAALRAVLGTSPLSLGSTALVSTWSRYLSGKSTKMAGNVSS